MRIHDAPLRVSDPADAVEREAERVADALVNDQPAFVHERFRGEVARSQCAGCAGGASPCEECGGEDEEPRVLRSADPTAGGLAAPARGAVTRAVASGGTPLSRDLRAFFAGRLRSSFDDVRVHTGPEAARAARSLSARAFTVGRDVVFGAGQFRPETPGGRRLIAHELVHTLQAEPGLIRRQVEAPERQVAAPAQKQPARSPSRGLVDLPRLDVRPSRHDTPCACIVFIHNDERNARRTAELMHEHCSYNLAIITPDTRARVLNRGVNVAEPARPGERRRPQKMKTDPNELFPRHIAEECINDPIACQNFVIDTAITGGPRTSRATVDEFILKRFFMAVHECSDAFRLPVVALHNNVLTDTERYRTKLEGASQRGQVVNELRGLGVDKSRGETTSPLEDRLGKKPFDETVRNELMRGSTNIVKWCTLSEIGRCHVGDPEHPDRVIWTTKPDDFEKLRLTNVNVVLQTSAGKPGGESDTDLSTLFLTLRDVIDRPILDAIEKDIAVDVADLRRALEQLLGAPRTEGTRGAIEAFMSLIRRALQYADAVNAKAVKVARLRYVNIETGGTAWKDQTPGERVDNFGFILSTLRTLGLECCGKPDDPHGGPEEKAVEKGLKVESEP